MQTAQTNTKQSRRIPGKALSSSKSWHERPYILLLRALVTLSLITVIGNLTHGNLSFGSTGATSASPELVNTQTTEPTPKVFEWTTMYTLSGNGSRQTDSFTSYHDWHIAWTCDLTSFDGQAYFLIIEVDYPDGSVADSGVNVMCTKDHTRDVYVVHAIGTFSLHIMSIGTWAVEVQEWKQIQS